ncbi:MAG: PIG-L family deacetylase, partial [Planctomycetota bacterium]
GKPPRDMPLVVAPRVSVRIPKASGLIPLQGGQSHRVEVRLESVAETADGALRLELPESWTSEPRSYAFSFSRSGETASYSFLVTPGERRVGTYALRAIATSAGRSYREGFRVVEAPDVGSMDLYVPAIQNVTVANVAIAENLKIGYVRGSGDEVAESLADLGITPRFLEASDLAGLDLQSFDAIVIGVRAYAVRPDLRKSNARILEYAKRGGVVIVQYQTPEFDKNYGPYPYTMGRAEEVSEEDAAVKILAPTHPALVAPNQISNADFKGWVEQRGSKFLATWDKRYVPLFESADRNQAPQRGGMVFARYGEGAWVYAAYSWYRQLPNGVPGAYRIFANLISLRRTLR